MANILAVIPARSGSKRFPGKNLQQLHGKNLIQHAFGAAYAFTRYVVASVDTEEYRGVATDAGCSVMYLRPPDLAIDDASSIAVWQHEFEQAEAIFGVPFDLTLFLEPTSPLRVEEDLQRTLTQAAAYGAAATVSKVHTPPEKFFTLDRQGLVDLPADTRSHKMPQYYALNGAAYACDRGTLQAGMKQFCPVIIDRPMVSIDEPGDLTLCDALMTLQKEQ